MRRYRPARRQADRWKVDGLDDIAPVLLRLAQVALVAALGTLLRLGEELVGLILERLLQRSEANLAHEVILELIPLRLLGVERERVLALLGVVGVVAPQVPVATLYGESLLVLAATHVATILGRALDTVVDTRSVGDDERRTIVGLSLADSLQRLLVVGTHGDLGHIDVAVGGLHQTEVLLAHALATGGKLSDGAERRGLGRLATGVGIDLRVEHEDVDVLTLGEDVVETTVADIVGSTITTDDPL